MTDNLMKEINDLRKKAMKYDHIAQRFLEYSEKLEKIEELVKELRLEINPTLSMKTRAQSGINYKEAIDVAYNGMKLGLQISTQTIMKQDPEANLQIASYIMDKLKKLPGTDTRKEGRTVYVFLKNTI